MGFGWFGWFGRVVAGGVPSVLDRRVSSMRSAHPGLEPGHGRIYKGGVSLLSWSGAIAQAVCIRSHGSHPLVGALFGVQSLKASPVGSKCA